MMTRVVSVGKSALALYEYFMRIWANFNGLVWFVTEK